MTDKALTIIRGAEVFDGERLLGARDVVLDDGLIHSVLEPRGDEFYAATAHEALGRIFEVSGAGTARVIDGRGKLLCPGFTDLHAHLRDPGYTWKEDLDSGARAAAAGGYTTVVCMPNTNPPIDSAPTAVYIREKARRAGICRVSPAGCLSRGREGLALADLAALYACGVRIFSDDGSDTVSNAVFLHAFEFLSMLPGARTMVHAEAPDLAHGVMHEGRVSAVLGQPGMHALAEDLGNARAILTSLATGQSVQITHIASQGSLELVRYGKAQALARGQAGLITADTTFNHLLLTHEAVREQGTLAKINPPLRAEDDRLALLTALADGTLDALITDHAPHSADEKAQEIEYAPFGCTGFELCFGLLNAHAVGVETPAGVITLERVLQLLTSGPARILRGKCQPAAQAGQYPQLTHAALREFNPQTIEVSPGHIAPGLAADLTLLDLSAEWEVDPARLFSKGHNTPFGGWRARGRVELTFMGGQPVYEHA
jgi:dihydroorotase